MIKIGLEEHKETILEALQDYRQWFIDGVTAFADEFSESDSEKVNNIDNAIEFVRGA